ncbi:MAG: DNA polymerase clamp loader subunit A [Candidatus Nanopelagicaceae bacterium]
MIELKDWLNSINFSKKNLMEEDPSLKKEYAPYIINRCLSGHIDCVLFVNEMNKYSNLDKDMQYSFLLNTLRKKKRFSPWLRKDSVKDLECVKQYYGYSNEKASQALKILRNDQINWIKQRLDTGGTK